MVLTACRAGCHGPGGGNRPALTCGLLLLKEETKLSLVITEATGSSKPFQALLPRNKWPVTGNKGGGRAPLEMGVTEGIQRGTDLESGRWGCPWGPLLPARRLQALLRCAGCCWAVGDTSACVSCPGRHDCGLRPVEVRSETSTVQAQGWCAWRDSIGPRSRCG